VLSEGLSLVPADDARVVDLYAHAYGGGPVVEGPRKRIVGLVGPSADARHDVALLVAERAPVFLHRFLDAPRRLATELLGGAGAVAAAGAGPVPGAGSYRFLRDLEDRLVVTAQRLTAPTALGVERAADVAAALQELHGAVEAAARGLTVDLLTQCVCVAGVRVDGTLWTRLAIERARRAARTVLLVDAVHPQQIAAIKATPRGFCAFVEPAGFAGESPLLGECEVRVAVTPDDPRATEAQVGALVEVIA
jgi:hypothetical protein